MYLQNTQYRSCFRPEVRSRLKVHDTHVKRPWRNRQSSGRILNTHNIM